MVDIDSLPRFLREREVVPFSYNAENDNFLVGINKKAYSIEDFNTSVLSKESGIIDSQLGTLSVGTISGHWIIAGPIFYDFVCSSESQEVILNTKEVMWTAYNLVNPVKAPRNTIGGSFGFEAHKYREGTVIFSVLGSCACLGAISDGILRSSYVEDTGKFQEYEPHNIDYRAQEIGLYAGIGYIAEKALEASS